MGVRRCAGVGEGKFDLMTGGSRVGGGDKIGHKDREAYALSRLKKHTNGPVFLQLS